MILIIGSNHDDVLYYESLLSDPREESILNDKYHVLIGKISSQEVMVIQDVYTSYVSSMLVTYLIDHYFISLVINVGRCEAISDLKVGDIALSESVIFGDVDQIAAAKGTTLGQIPGYQRSFAIPSNMIRNMYSSLEKIVDKKFVSATFVSSSFFRQSKEMVGDITKDEYIMSLNKNIVLDGESAGLALACQLNRTPFIAVKVVEAKAGNYTTLEDYLLILGEYASLGKAISNFIGEISRTDILRVGGM